MKLYIFGLIILSVWFSFTRSSRIGLKGERHVAKILSRLPEDDYIVINDLMIFNEYGTSQIDHVVLSIYGIFVIETKNYNGLIYGKENSEQWTKNVFGNKYSFRNPIKQNYGHVKALENRLNISKSAFIPIVVFTNRANIIGEYKSTVIYTDELLDEISSRNTKLFSRLQIEEYKKKLIFNVSYTKLQKIKHVNDIKTNLKNRDKLIRKGICPKCGGTLKERNGKYGLFYGCSNYPKCKFTLNE